MSRKLEGKVAVITGGTAGIGLATAKLLASEGAHLFVTGRRQAELDAAIQNIGGNAVGVCGDVGKLADVTGLYNRIARDHAHIDVIFANAGEVEAAPLGAISEEHFDRMFATNVKGVLFTVQSALPLLRDGASIILTGSISGSTGRAGSSIYSGAKAAVRAFARTWILDLRTRRIRVNVISPGVIRTPAMERFLGDGPERAALEASVVESIPSGRIGNPEDIAQVVLFLASDDSSYVNGAELFADGGVAQI